MRSIPSNIPDPLLDACALTTAYKSKGALKQDDLRRRREEQQVEIRRQKREENISKRRNFLPAASADSDDESGGVSWEAPVRARALCTIHGVSDHIYDLARGGDDFWRFLR